MIDWHEIDLKNKKSGQLKVVCPKCSHERKKKLDPCLSVNIDKGMAHCWHCDEISIRDYEKKDHSKKYELPPQDWTNYTNISDKIVKWFSERGISQRTLIECKITEEQYYQPAKQKKMNNIVFNYFEGTELVNKKYRSSVKDFTQSKNAKKIFYGINDVVEHEECYVCEGEIDKLSFWEIGVRNVISVPNGAKDNSDYFENCEEYLKGIKRFYIAVDMDEPGRSLEKSLIKRLGKHRCSRIRFLGKDANEDLVNDRLQFEKTILEFHHYPVDGTFTAKDIEKDIHALYDNGYDQGIKPGEAFKNLNRSFSIIPGQLITVTGIPSHGKSNFIEWYVISLVNDLGLKASFYSPEHFPMHLHQSTLAEKVIGKSFMGVSNRDRMSRTELNSYINWSKDKIYLTIPEKAEIPNWDWLFTKFEEQIYRYGIDLFVIDAFNKVKLLNGSLTELSDVLARLTLFCQMHNVNIFLIAHPTKMKKNEDGKYLIPTLYDVKGTGDFYDQTHCGLTVYREFDINDPHIKVLITKVKYKHQGSINETAFFRYNETNGRFYDYNGHADNKSIIEDRAGTVEMFPEKAPF